MRDGFDQAEIGAEGVFDDLLAVAGGSSGLDDHAGEAAVDLLQKLAHERNRVAAVG